MSVLPQALLGSAGAPNALVAALDAHRSDAAVQHRGCRAIYNLVKVVLVLL